MAKIGKRPAPPDDFDLYLKRLRAYLAGEEIERDGHPSRIEWLDSTSVPPVPIEVAATGPKVIEIAARRADRICFAVGADTERLGECIARARRFHPGLLGEDTSSESGGQAGDATIFREFSKNDFLRKWVTKCA